MEKTCGGGRLHSIKNPNVKPFFKKESFTKETRKTLWKRVRYEVIDKSFLKKESFTKETGFSQLKERCPGHLWAKKSFINKLLEKV